MTLFRVLVAAVVIGVVASASATAGSLITGAKVKDGSLTGADIKNRSLTAQDLKRSALMRGPAGERGPQGPQGPVGAAGPQGGGVLADISGSVTLPAVQSPTTVPISLNGASFTSRTATWIAGAASFPNGDPCAGAQRVPTILTIYVDGIRQSYVGSGDVVPSTPSTMPFGFTVPPGSHTITAEGRAACSNAPLTMRLWMTALGQ